MGLNCNACPVRHRAACSVLSGEEREALAKSGRGRKLRRGELLFAAGDENAACATLLKGALKVRAQVHRPLRAFPNVDTAALTRD